MMMETESVSPGAEPGAGSGAESESGGGRAWMPGLSPRGPGRLALPTLGKLRHEGEGRARRPCPLGERGAPKGPGSLPPPNHCLP